MNNNKKVFILLGIIITILLIVTIAYHNRDRRTYELNLPQVGQNQITSNLPTENNNRNPENVTIEVLKDTITNKTVEILITDNNVEQYGWGVEFRVEQKVNGEWKELEYISDDLSWIEIAYKLDGNNQVKMKVNFEKYYGTLESGIYRIVKPVYDNRYIDLYSNEFEIK